ncbi:hypothetical protein ADLECEL_19990 [Adlercreutzia equolifaciens subsp. celatus]|nr:hypothetical protein ADLECEL_19990 [Adlercreutzia equolifaciens subsp. celatus]
MPFGTDCDSRKGSGRNRGLDYRQNVEHVSAARGITNGKAYRTQPSWKTPAMKNGSKPVDVPQKTNERRCLEGNL